MLSIVLEYNSIAIAAWSKDGYSQASPVVVNGDVQKGDIQGNLIF